MPPPTTTTSGAGPAVSAGLAGRALITRGDTPAARPTSLDTETTAFTVLPR